VDLKKKKKRVYKMPFQVSRSFWCELGIGPAWAATESQIARPKKEKEKKN
jgi:hypothetical protein